MPYIKMNSKCIKNLNIGLKTVKLSEENIGEKFYDTGFGNDFLDITPKVQAIKEKNQNFIKIKTFYVSKVIIDRVKRQPMGWEKYMQIMYLWLTVPFSEYLYHQGSYVLWTQK